MRMNRLWTILILALGFLTIGCSTGRITSLRGAANTIADSKKPGEYIKVEIVDNYDETTKYFISKFPNSQPIEKELMKINK